MVSHLKAPLRSIDTLINFIQDNESLMNEANLKSLNKILLNVENGFVNCRDIKLFLY
jgi:hypothetical protein